jgi:hypothetical protein
LTAGMGPEPGKLPRHTVSKICLNQPPIFREASNEMPVQRKPEPHDAWTGSRHARFAPTVIMLCRGCNLLAKVGLSELPGGYLHRSARPVR